MKRKLCNSVNLEQLILKPSFPTGSKQGCPANGIDGRQKSSAGCFFVFPVAKTPARQFILSDLGASDIISIFPRFWEAERGGDDVGIRILGSLRHGRTIPMFYMEATTLFGKNMGLVAKPFFSFCQLPSGMTFINKGKTV